MSGLQASREGIRARLEGARVALLAHRNADLDAVGSIALLYSTLSRVADSVCVYVPEGLSRPARLALERLALELPSCPEAEEGSYDVAISVDAANLVQLGDAAAIYKGASFRIAIDHHERGSIHEAADEAFVEPGASSTVEVTVFFLDTLGLEPRDPRAATIAMAGLVSDSRRFLIVGRRSFAAAQRLVDWGADYKVALDLAQAAKHPGSEAEKLGERVARLKAFSRLRLARACKDVLIAVTHIGSYESAVARSLVEEGADVAIVVTERREYFRVSVRTSRRALASGVTAAEVARFIAERYGGEGGGHEAAAMAHVPASVATSAEELANAIARSVPGRVSRLCVEARKERGAGGSSDGRGWG